ncbi:B-4DMT family transporter [Mycobacterium sp. HUMS_1102779]|uniref:B-4DMT family transporter n=1 Tax=Mycobacterium sp. HUMS_1102779 TaxID=3383487 RepID=UPI0038999E76
MTNWMLRGLVFAGVMVVVRLIQGTIVNAWPTQAGLVSIVLLLLFTAAAFVWGVLDGRADATANPDPDRRRDLAMTWLLAGLVAGVLSGAVSWVIALVYKGLYTGGLINELTTFAAFTALIAFLAAIVGATVGRWRVDRNPPPRGAGTDGERADTDVFSAVRGDDTPTGEMAVPAAAAAAAAPAAVATAEREAPTETLPTSTWGGTTEATPAAADDAKTEVIKPVPAAEAIEATEATEAASEPPSEEPDRG